MTDKLLISGLVLCVLLCFSVVPSAGAASMWSQTYGTGDVWACSMIATPDGGYAIVGVTALNSIWLVKTDALGNKEWERTYNGAGEPSLVTTSDGGYAIASYIYTFMGDGSTDFWLIKTDSLGNMQWNKTYGGQGYDMAYSLVATSDGGFDHEEAHHPELLPVNSGTRHSDRRGSPAG